MNVIVYGASDDLIEVECPLFNEEFSATSTAPNGDLLAFSNGSVLRIRYDASGIWRITPVVDPESYWSIKHAPEGDEDNYSDEATCDFGDIPVRVVRGTDIAGAPMPARGRA